MRDINPNYVIPTNGTPEGEVTFDLLTAIANRLILDLQFKSGKPPQITDFLDGVNQQNWEDYISYLMELDTEITEEEGKLLADPKMGQSYFLSKYHPDQAVREMIAAELQS